MFIGLYIVVLKLASPVDENMKDLDVHDITKRSESEESPGNQNDLLSGLSLQSEYHRL